LQHSGRRGVLYLSGAMRAARLPGPAAAAGAPARCRSESESIAWAAWGARASGGAAANRSPKRRAV
jgi:hypothetical protein